MHLVDWIAEGGLTNISWSGTEDPDLLATKTRWVDTHIIGVMFCTQCLCFHLFCLYFDVRFKVGAVSGSMFVFVLILCLSLVVAFYK